MVGWGKSTVARFGLGAVALVWASQSVGAVHTIALRGDEAIPASAATFSSFSTPSLNNRGQVAFAAQLAGSGVTTSNDTGFWIAGPGSLQAVAREGGQAPGMPAGTVFGSLSAFSGLPLNEAGEIAAGIQVTGSSGIWVGNSSSLTLLATQGTAAPGAQSGSVFASLDGVLTSLNRSGDVAFTASLVGEPYNSINSSFNSRDGVWVLNRNGVVGSVLAGTSVPELGAAAQILEFSTSARPALNPLGEVAFAAGYKTTASSTSLQSIWVAHGSGLELRNYTFQPYPALGPNANLQTPQQPGFNGLGTAATKLSFVGAGGSPASGDAIATSQSSGVSLAARSGDSAPDIPGFAFRSLSYLPSIGGGGHLAFYGSVSDSSNSNRKSGIWAGRPDSLHLVTFEGAAAPNTDSQFSQFIRNTPAINRFGQIAFSADLTNSASGQNGASLWATNLDGQLAMIARVSGVLEVAPGDTRTISALAMLTNSGDQDGRPRSLNDLGQVAFGATFTDGTSGIFLSNAVAHLPGDYNGNGMVDAGDYVTWRKGVATQNLAADGNRDGAVDGGDYDLVREFYGQSLTPTGSGLSVTAVPEPVATLLLIAVSGLRFRRRSE